MSNITTDTLFSLRKATKGGNVQRVPANSATCLENSAIGFRPSTGYAVRWSATAGDLFMGFATKAVTSGTEFDVSDELCGKIICGTTNEDGLLVAGLTAQTLCPAPVYLNSTDNISADLTITPTGPAIGLALKCVSSGYGWVMFFHPATTNQNSLAFDPTNIASLAAAGSAQGSAAAIVDDITNVTGADGTKGVVLPLAAAGDVRVVYNNSTSALLVYPNTSDDINDGSANASISMAAKTVATFRALDATTWSYDEKVDLRNAQTIVGVKTLTTPKMDVIAEATSALGVHIDSLGVQDGRIHEVRTVSAKTTVVTLTIAELLTGIITGTHAAGADQAYTLPLGTDCEAARTWATNETFEWSLVNLSGTPATNTITITANTGHTIVGPGVVVGSATAALNTRRCLTRRSAANTFITYVF